MEYTQGSRLMLRGKLHAPPVSISYTNLSQHTCVSHVISAQADIHALVPRCCRPPSQDSESNDSVSWRGCFRLGAILNQLATSSTHLHNELQEKMQKSAEGSSIMHGAAVNGSSPPPRISWCVFQSVIVMCSTLLYFGQMM
jgi:hypothetical protein